MVSVTAPKHDCRKVPNCWPEGTEAPKLGLQSPTQKSLTATWPAGELIPPGPPQRTSLVLTPPLWVHGPKQPEYLNKQEQWTPHIRGACTPFPRPLAGVLQPSLSHCPSSLRDHDNITVQCSESALWPVRCQRDLPGREGRIPSGQVALL